MNFRRIYWTNWNDRQASIQRAYTNGWNVETLIKTHIRTPNGLAIDHSPQKLYWSDARLDKIERCNYDGSDRKVSLGGRGVAPDATVEWDDQKPHGFPPNDAMFWNQKLRFVVD